MVWERLQALLEGMSPEKKAMAGGAGGAPKKPKKNKGTGESIDVEMNDMGQQLKQTANERNRKSMDFPAWNREVEKFLKHVLKHKEKGETNFGKFNEAEKEAAYTSGFSEGDDADVIGYRQFVYDSGMSYDDYIGNIVKMFSQKMGLWHGLRGRIYDELAGKRFEKQKEKDIFGASKQQYSRADLEKDTAEFREFEKWARDVADAYLKDAQGNPIPYDEKSFQETLHYFASSGQRMGVTGGTESSGVYPGGEEPTEPGVDVSRKDTTGIPEQPKPGSPEDYEYWKKRYEASLKEIVVHQDPEQEIPYGTGEAGSLGVPLYKHLMKMDRGAAATVFITQLRKNMEANERLQGQAQQQIDQPYKVPEPPADWPEEMKQQWRKQQAQKGMMVPAGSPSEKQIDPELFRKKRRAPSEHEKRKFATWWDPFGFRGNIPYSDM